VIRKDPVPDIQRLEQLVQDIRRGDIRLPKFQRPFVWDRDDMLNLWDSIYNSYPIGSVLLWHSSERLKSEREIFGFSVQDVTTDVYPTQYLLDGQQRLTTVCGSLYWDGQGLNSIWAIHFDLDTEKFVYPKNPSQINLFPLNKLLDTSDFIRQCMKFEAAPDPKKYYKAAENLLKVVKDYKVAVVKIGNVTLDEVAPIFERVNSKGRKLTMVDLMRAATWKDGFDLTASIEDFQEALSETGFPEIPENVILRGVAMAAGLGVNKADVDGLRNLPSAALSAGFMEARAATTLAVKFFIEWFGLDDYSYLPYGIQLTYLAELIRLNPNLTNTQINEVQQWFWTTSVRGYFGGASTGQNSRDLIAIRAFAQGMTAKIPPDEIVLDITDFLFGDFNMRTAASTAFVLMLRHLSPEFDVRHRPVELIFGSKKDRIHYLDLFAGTSFSGLNLGQCLRGVGDPLTIENDSKNLISNLVSEEILAEDVSVAEQISSRLKLISAHVSKLTGRDCHYSIPPRFLLQ
jgi:hypothetical protein